MHRIGRVGRAGREGVAITLVPPSKVHALRAVERLTGQPIEIAPVPTAADLRAARLERTRTALLEQLADEQADDGVTAMIESLAAEHDPVAVAAAAVRLLQSAGGDPDDGADIPVVSAGRGDRSSRAAWSRWPGRGHPRAEGRHRPAVRQRGPGQRGAAAGHRGRAGQRVATCPAGTSGRSRSTSGTRWWRSPSTPRTTCCAACAAPPPSRAAGPTSAATATWPPPVVPAATDPPAPPARRHCRAIGWRDSAVRAFGGVPWPRSTASHAVARSPTGWSAPPRAACCARSACATRTSASRRSASRPAGTRSPRATCRCSGSGSRPRRACTGPAGSRWSSAPSRSPTASRWATSGCTTRWSPARSSPTRWRPWCRPSGSTAPCCWPAATRACPAC